MIIIEIQQLVNQLEAVLNEGKHVPFSQNILIDEEACRRIIDQMRVSVPDVIKQAERTLGERDRIIAQAHEEADRIVKLAREQATDLVEEHQLVATARRRGDELVVAAEREAATMRSEADQYAMNALRQLAGQIESIQREIDNGIKTLQALMTRR